MNLVLIIAIFGLQTTLILMWVFTLKGKLNSLGKEIQAINTHVDGQADKVIAEIEERGQFEEKALGTLAQNVAVCGYELKEIKNNIDSNTNKLKEDIKKSTHIIVTTPVKTRI